MITANDIKKIRTGSKLITGNDIASIRKRQQYEQQSKEAEQKRQMQKSTSQQENKIIGPQRLPEELSYLKHKNEPIDYSSITKKADFEEKSKSAGKKPSWLYNAFSGTIFDWGQFKDEKAQISGLEDRYRQALAKKDMDTISSIDSMTETEKGIYNYIFNTEGREQADKYLDDYLKSYRKTKTEQWTEDVKKFAEEHPVLGSIASVAAAPIGIAGTIDTIKKRIRGEEIDPNSSAFVGTQTREAVQEGVTKNMGNVGKFLYSTGLSILDSLLASTGGPVLGSLMLAGGASSDAIKDAKERGATDKQALLSGLTSGAAEAIFERISLGNLDALKETPIRSIRDIAKNTVKSVFVNASEEAATELANTITDQIIMQDLSNYSLAYDAYKKSGMDDATARKMANREIAKQIGLSALGGALAGGVLAGVGQGINYATGSRIGSQVSNADAETMTEQAKASGDTDLYNLALEIEKRKQAGKQPTNYQKGRLAVETSRINMPKNDLQPEGTNITTQARENISKEETSPKTEINVKNAPAKWNGIEGAKVTGISKVENNVAKVTIESGGETIVDNLENVEFENPDVEAIYSMAEQYKTNGAKSFVSNYQDNLDLDTYKKAFDAYYDAGLINLPMDKISSAYGALLDDNIKYAAYQAGQNDGKALTPKAVSPDYTGVVETEAAKKMDADIRESLDALGKAVGVKIQIEESLAGGQANGLYRDGTLYIALDSQNPYMVVAKHELTHAIQESSPEMYKKYKDFVISEINKSNPEAYNEMVERLIKRYAEIGETITRDQAQDEIVADATEMFFTDADVIERLAKEDRSLAEKIIDFIKDLIKKIQGALQGVEPKSKAAKILNENLDVAKEAERLWTEALFSKNRIDNTEDGMYNEIKAMLSENHEEYKTNKEDLEYATEAIRDLEKFRNSVSGKRRKVDRTGAGIRTIADGITRDFIQKGYINLKGTKVNSPAELAEIAQVFRDPRFETVRIFYIKNNEIVAHEGITSRIPGLSVIFSGGPRRSDFASDSEFYTAYKEYQQNIFEEMKDRMRRLKADGYYILHNHPSGNPTPSLADIKSTKLYENSVPGFKGHVIINSNTYSVIDTSLSPYDDQPIYNLDQQKLDFLLQPSIQHKLLGEKIDTPDKLSAVAKALQLSKNVSCIIYASAKGEIRGIQEVPNGFILSKDFKGFLRNQSVEFGSSNVFIHTNSQDIYDKSRELVKEKYIIDAVLRAGLSLRSLGYNPDDKYAWAGILEGDITGYRVNENSNQYSLKEIKEITDKAEKEFGTTYDFKEAGYLTINGKLLDFSGKKFGASGGYRTMDHREISDILDLPENAGYSDGMIKFMNMGNIRLQEYGIDISVMPNEKQIPVLKRFIDVHNGEITVDFSLPNGNIDGSIEYPEGTKSSRIISDIKRYFETGVVPELSGVVMFRYQLKDVDPIEYRRLKAENEKLQKAYDLLKQQFELTADFAPDRTVLERKAKAILKKYNSKYDLDTFVDNMEKVWKYIQGNRDNLQVGQTVQALTGMTKQILEKSSVKDTTLRDQYKELIDGIRNTKITLQNQDRADLATEGGYQAFKRKYRGKINLVDEGGMSVDSFFQELSSLYPELFNAEEITHPAEQLIKIADVLDSLKPISYNPYTEYGMNMDEAAFNMALDIVDEVFLTPQVKPLTAAELKQKLTETEQKHKEELQKLHAKYQETIEDIRKEYRSWYNERLERIKAENEKQVQKLLERHAKASEKEKEKFMRQIQRLRDSKLQMLKAQQDRFNERMKAYKERKSAQSDMNRWKSNIKKIAKDLSDQLLRPTDTRHIPAGLRSSIIQVCQILDFETGRTGPQGEPTRATERLRALKDAYDKLSKEIDDSISAFYDEDMSAAISDLANAIQGRRINQLDYNELKQVYDIMKHIRHIVRLENQMFNDTIRETVAMAGEEQMNRHNSEKEFKQMDIVAKNKALKAFADLLGKGNIKPYYFFKQLGGPLEKLYKSIRDGEDTFVRDFEKGKNYAKEMTEKYNYFNWAKDDKPEEFTTVKGEKISLTTGEKLYIYMAYQREQGKGHILKGGVVPSSAITKKGKTTEQYKPVQFSERDIENLKNSLTDDQINFAKEMVKYLSNDLAKLGNEVSLKMYGYEKFTEKNYIPLTSDPNFLASKPGVLDDRRIKRAGFTKALTPRASNPIIAADFLEVWSKHLVDMSMYHAFVLPITDFERVWNYRIRNKDGTTSSVKQSIQRAYGKRANDYIKNLLNDINGGIKAPVGGELSNILLSKMKADAVMGNLSVAIQQPSSIARAMVIINPKYFIKTTFTKRSYNELLKYSPQAVLKQYGYFDVNMGRNLTDLITKPEYEGLEKLKAFFKDKNVRNEVFSWLPQKMDELTWGHIWNAIKEETKAETNLIEGTEEFYQHCAERFKEVIDRTQVMDSVFQRSEIMRSQNAFTKIATSFMAEPTVSYNMLYDAIKEAKKKGKGASVYVTRSVASVVAAMVLNSLLKSIITAMRDKDDEKEYAEKYLSAFIKNLIDDPVGMIPYVNTVYSIFQGYEANRPDMQLIQNLYYAWAKLDSDKYSTQEKVLQVAQAIAPFFDVPLKNVTRDVEAIFRNGKYIFEKAGLLEALPEYEKLKIKYDINDLGNSTATKAYYDYLYSVRDTEEYNKVYQDLLRSGRKPSNIEQAMIDRRRIELYNRKEGEEYTHPLITDAVEALKQNNTQKYRTVIEKLQKEGYEPKDILYAINSLKSEQAKENAPSPEEFIEVYKTGDETKWKPIYKKMRDAGWSQKDLLSLIK